MERGLSGCHRFTLIRKEIYYLATNNYEQNELKLSELSTLFFLHRSVIYLK